MLPKQVESELFDLNNHVNDNIIEYISDELWHHGLTLLEVTDCDVYVYIDFIGENIVGELRIDRFKKHYEIVARTINETILPVRGSWDIIEKYLICLSMNK